jgi:chemotaxis protein CheD
VNVRFIKEFLQNEKIPLIAADLGGVVGRVINFHSQDFSVYVRKIIAKTAKVVQREEQYWKQTIRRQEETETQVDLW